MNAALILQLVATVIMVVGIGFGLQNIRHYQAARRRESAILMLNSFQTGEFVHGLLIVLGMPVGVTKAQVDGLPVDELRAFYVVLGTWERLGVLVFRGEVGMDLVDDAYSGPILLSWERLADFIGEFRAELGRDTGFEWFQWLAERLAEREVEASPVPAYVAHRAWRADQGHSIR